MLKKNNARIVDNFFWIIWGLVILLLLIKNAPKIYAILGEESSLRAYIAIYISFVAVLAWGFKALYGHLGSVRFGMAIFAGALLIRLIALYWGTYVLSDDFNNYYRMSYAFYLGDYQTVQELTSAYFPELAGMSVFYGLLAHVFSPGLLGFQVINCILTSLICVWIYVLGCLFSREVGAVAAFLYMTYPTSIVSSQITTNHHAATFFLLSAVYVFCQFLDCGTQGNRKKEVLWGVGTAALLVCSNYMHTSIAVTICAFIAFCGVRIIGNFIKKGKSSQLKRNIRLVSRISMVVVLYAVLSSGGLSLMSRSGLCAPGATGGILDSVYYKIWLGLDVEHGGLWWYEGVSQYMELPNAAERRQYCLEGIKQNLENPNAVAKLMWDKTSKAWFSPDTYYSFYFFGESYILASELQEADDPARVDELQNLQTDLYVMQDMFNKFDEVYLYVIWILVLVGLFALIWMPSVTILDLTTWIPLGWMCFISITEMQSRYRYQSMPALMLLAGLGAIYLHKKLSVKRLLPSAATEKERDGQNE